MTFEEWWSRNCVGTPEEKRIARDGWEAAVSSFVDLLRRDHDEDERIQIRTAIEIARTGKTWRDKT